MMKKRLFALLFLFVLVVGTVSTHGIVTASAAETEKSEQGVSKEEFKKAVAGYTVGIDINEAEQRFEINSKEISKIKIKSQKISSDGKRLTTKAYIYVNRSVATVKAYATVKFKKSGDSWKVKSVSVKKGSLYKIPLKGEWVGTYDFEGTTKLVIKVNKVSKDGYILDGERAWLSTPTHKVSEGSFTITGGYDIKTGKVCFFADKKLTGEYDSISDLECYIDLENKRLVGNRETSLEKKK